MAEYNFQAGKDIGLFKKYSQVQVENIELILVKCGAYGLTKNEIAYVLATAYHEAYNPIIPNSRITPIKEFGGEKYLKSKKYYPFYGRGFVQLTWKENYQKESKRLSIDLINNPDLALDPVVAADILVHGMKFGSFTGIKLSDYINSKVCDYVNARRIINGKDKAQQIAGYANRFLSCISE